MERVADTRDMRHIPVMELAGKVGRKVTSLVSCDQSQDEKCDGEAAGSGQEGFSQCGKSWLK